MPGPVTKDKNGGVYYRPGIPFPIFDIKRLKDDFSVQITKTSAVMLGFTAVASEGFKKVIHESFPAEEKKKFFYLNILESVDNKYVNKEIKKVLNGQGTPREEDDGSQKIFRGDGYARDPKKYGSQKKWVGSLEWDVPESKNVHDRILEKTNKDGTKSYGYSETADYQKIHEIKKK